VKLEFAVSILILAVPRGNDPRPLAWQASMRPWTPWDQIWWIVKESNLIANHPTY